MENHHAINGKINYFDWAIFNSFLYVYQRLELISQLMGAARAMFYPGSPPRQCPGGATSHACSRPDVALPEYPHGKTTGKSKIYRFFMVFHHSICSIFRVNLCFKSGMIHLQFDAWSNWNPNGLWSRRWQPEIISSDGNGNFSSKKREESGYCTINVRI